MLTLKNYIENINKYISNTSKLSLKKREESSIAIEGLEEILSYLNNFEASNGNGFIGDDILNRK